MKRDNHEDAFLHKYKYEAISFVQTTSIAKYISLLSVLKVETSIMATKTTKQDTASQTLTTSAIETSNPSGPRIYHVGRSVWTFSHVLDSDRSTYLYMIDTNHGKIKDAPGMTIKSAATSRVVGTIQEYALSKTIDLTVNDKPMPLEAISAVSTGRVFTSRARPGRTLTWMYDSAVSLGLECVDEEGKVVASTSLLVPTYRLRDFFGIARYVS